MKQCQLPLRALLLRRKGPTEVRQAKGRSSSNSTSSSNSKQELFVTLKWCDKGLQLIRCGSKRSRSYKIRQESGGFAGRAVNQNPSRSLSQSLRLSRFSVQLPVLSSKPSSSSSSVISSSSHLSARLLWMPFPKPCRNPEGGGMRRKRMNSSKPDAWKKADWQKDDWKKDDWKTQWQRTPTTPSPATAAATAAPDTPSPPASVAPTVASTPEGVHAGSALRERASAIALIIKECLWSDLVGACWPCASHIISATTIMHQSASWDAEPMWVHESLAKSGSQQNFDVCETWSQACRASCSSKHEREKIHQLSFIDICCRVNIL